jgi:hypothetical protein
VNEIDAAKLVRFDEFNAQLQPKFEWPVAYPVARAYVDQLERGNALEAGRVTALREMMTRGETGRGTQRTQALEQFARAAEQLDRDAATARPIDARRMRALATTLRGLQAAR